MAAPVIDSRISILNFEEGETVSIQLSATNSPNSWAGVTLPSGLSINSSGLISGTLTQAAGVHHSTIQATNADPATGELAVVFVIRKGQLLPDGGMKIPIDFDLLSKVVTIEGIPEDYIYGPPVFQQRETGRRRPLLPLHVGERMEVSIGLKRGTEYQDLDLTSLKFPVKNFEDEDEIELISGKTKVGSGTATRYEAVLNVVPAVDDILADYESPNGTFADLFGQIQLEILNAGNEYDTTNTDTLTLAKNTTVNDTFVFTGLPEVTSVTRYTFDLDLVVTGYTSQNVSLTVTADIAYDDVNDIFVVSNQSGTTSGQGADEEPGHWRSTFSLQSITATANGVDVAVRSVASNIPDKLTIPAGSSAGDWTIVSGAIEFSTPGDSETFQVSDDGGPPVQSPFDLDDGDTVSDILTNVNNTGGTTDGDISEVVFEGQNIVFYFNSSYTVSEISGDDSGAFSPVPGDTDSEAGSHSVQVAGNALDDVYSRKSETCIIRFERGL